MSHAPAAGMSGAGERAKATGRLYIVGGQQRTLRPMHALQDWYQYQRGLILDLDVQSGEARTVVSYVSPAEACPPDEPTILFKSGTYSGDLLYVTTQTEILIYRTPGFEQVGYLSLPQFNDVHHVRPTATDTLLIANTGLDMVMELTLEGRIVREWNVLDEPLWERFSRTVDYRRIHTTKPHHAHPNHVFTVGEEIWATRFEQRDAICLTQPGRRIDIGLERVHDGILVDGRVYFTTVDGKVVIADPAECRVLEVVDLTAMHEGDTLLGWCRGILVEGDVIWVGFSRIRPTKFRENIGWVLRGFKRDFGTHVASYDLARRECLAQIPVESFGLSAVFGVFRVPDRGAEATEPSIRSS